MTRFYFILALLMGSINHCFSQENNEVDPVYAFGFSTSFNDTVVYLTTIQLLPDACIQKGTNFLIERDKYSEQFKKHLESKNFGHETSAVFYNKSKKELEKTYIKVRRHQQKKKGIKFIEIPLSDFSFTSIYQ